MSSNNNIQHNDPIKRFVEKESGPEMSPMDPPDAYNPLNINPLPYEKMHPFLQKLIDEHKVFTDVLVKFETALVTWRKNAWNFTPEIDMGLKQFFVYFDEHVALHNQKEEQKLFPLLHKKLVERGEHNSQNSSVTGINTMEDEHNKVMQAAAIAFNFLGLGSRLPDAQSRQMTYQAAFDQGLAIIETMKLHIFREENILFPQAMQYFSEQELAFWNKEE